MFMHFKPAMVLFTILTLVTGAIYPAAVTALAQILFPWQANGSLIAEGQDKKVGSALIGQAFGDSKYFWGRPSATAPYPYNGGASSGSNLGPTNPALVDVVKVRIEALQAADPGNNTPVPVDLITASGSGLDPHISPAAAEYQVSRVSGAQGIAPDKLRELVTRYTEPRVFGLLGEPRVNVLMLNLALQGPHGPVVSE